MSERIENLKQAICQAETRAELDCVMATFPPAATPAERAEIAALLERRGAEFFEHARELGRYLAERKAAKVRAGEPGADK